MDLKDGVGKNIIKIHFMYVQNTEIINENNIF